MLIIARFEIIWELGHGGFGTVFLVHDNEIGEICALKMICSELAALAPVQANFAKELGYLDGDA